MEPVMAEPATQELREHLLSRIKLVAGPLETECWLFQTGTGHANLNWRRRTNRASRFSYWAFVGPIVEGNYVATNAMSPLASILTICFRAHHSTTSKTQ